MSYLIDSHCHLHDRQFFADKEAEKALTRAKERGVQKIVCIGTDPEDSLAARDFATQHENVFWTYGIHPEETSKVSEGSPKFMVLDGDFLAPKLVAIGEVGLDYHTDGYDRTRQIKLFEEMLQLALDNNLPLSFHVRNAFDDFFPVVANFPKVRGVVHSFTDSKKTLRRILETTEFYVGVNGLATYSTLPMPPLDRIMLETDAPFLAPVPHRGATNEPGFVGDVAEWLSKKLDVDFDMVAKVTTRNTEDLYKI